MKCSVESSIDSVLSINRTGKRPHLRSKILTKCLLILVLFGVSVVISACAGDIVSRSSVQPTERPVPTPVSSLIGSFVWQTDGQYGYQMLRPASWDAVDLGMERGYDTPGFLDTADRVQLQAVNYQVLKPGPNGIVVQKTLWEQNPSLDAWAAAIQHSWASNGVESTLLRTLPHARMYLVRSPGGSETQIVALAVDQDQPLGAGLTASGVYSNIQRLQEEGIVDDLIAMVESMQAILYNPANVDPPLSP